MRSVYGYFGWAIWLTLAGLALAFWLGWAFEGTPAGAFRFLLVGAVLAVLEVSLSFDNAIVNANTLRTMTPAWQQRFLTWGIVIAVFGMRIVFPLAVVAVAARIGPWDALVLAATDPPAYAALIGGAHLAISAFGGAFLAMVGLDYFVDPAKCVHWIKPVERGMARLAAVRGISAGAVTALMLCVALGPCRGARRRTSSPPPPRASAPTLPCRASAGSWMRAVLRRGLPRAAGPGRGVGPGRLPRPGSRAGGLGAFLYLEVLDASFSFDGVIGAFALTQNLFLISIGLGVGALFVRSMTVMLVERGTLAEFRYLECGAFWSILALALVMVAQTLVEVPEVVTGLAGAGLIALSFAASVRHRRRAAR